jgi:membrane-bound ClpP family serine protease
VSEAADADADGGSDADPGDGRDESVNERMDRNWGEILQELRVTQTGTQIFTGFLLSVAFQQRFSSLSPFQQHTYLVLVLLAVLTTAVGLAPVNLHRSLFRRHAKLLVVTVGHRVLRAMLFGVGLLLVGSVLLIFDVVTSRTAAVVAAGAVAAVIAVIAVLPKVLRSRTAPR